MGSFALAFNTILNWNDLDVAWPLNLKPAGRPRVAEDGVGDEHGP